MWVKFRHKVVYAILRPFFRIYCILKYRAKFDKRISLKDGALVICNHVTTMDPFFVSMLFKQPTYHMMSKDVLMHRFTGKLIKFLVNPIPKEKSKSTDITAIKNCVRVAKENGIINIFIEGNRTLSGELCYIDDSIVKLAKLLKKPLYIVNIIGGYHTDPRWANTIRRGKLEVKRVKVLEYDEIKKIKDDDLYNIICDNLNVDNYENLGAYKGRKLAEHLERILYICPVCGSYHTISTYKNDINCSSCGLNVKYTENFKFKSDNTNFNFEYVKDWYNYQIEEVKKNEYQDNEIIYQDNVGLYIPMVYQKKEKLGDCKMNIYNDRIDFVFENHNLSFDFNSIDGITLVGKKKMNIYVRDTTYQVFADLKLNLLKYMHLFYIIKNKNGGNDNEFLGL